MPATFKAGNHEYTLALNYTKARAIRESLQLDFVDLAGICDTFAKLDLNTDLLMQVLWDLVEPQAKSKNVTQDQFGEAFADGETFQAARDALAECAINFSDPRTREEIKKGLEITRTEIKKLVGSKMEAMSQPAASTGG